MAVPLSLRCGRRPTPPSPCAGLFLSSAQKPPRRYIPHNPCEGMSPTKRLPANAYSQISNFQMFFAPRLMGPTISLASSDFLSARDSASGEITALERPWISETDQTITLPDRITKTNLTTHFPMAGSRQALPRVRRVGTTRTTYSQLDASTSEGSRPQHSMVFKRQKQSSMNGAVSRAGRCMMYAGPSARGSRSLVCFRTSSSDSSTTKWAVSPTRRTA
jgi:hypothetical protein